MRVQWLQLDGWVWLRAKAVSLPGVHWPLSPWWDAGAGDEGPEPVTGGPGHFCRSVTTPTPPEMGPSPQSCWSRSPRVHVLQEGVLPHPALAPSAQARAGSGAVTEAGPDLQGVSVCCLCLVSGVSKCAHALQKKDLGFSQRSS